MVMVMMLSREGVEYVLFFFSGFFFGFLVKGRGRGGCG